MLHRREGVTEFLSCVVGMVCYEWWYLKLMLC